MNQIDLIACLLTEDINEVNDLPTLWYENNKGDKWYPNLKNDYADQENIPEGYDYQHSQFPTMLRHNILKIITAEDVNSCAHPEKYIVPTFGWIDGVEGRECKQCCGTQTKNVNEDWSPQWSSGHSKQIMTGESGWSEDLVFAIAEKNGHKVGQAILQVANSCERCMNVLANNYGLEWGYPKESEDYARSGTQCDFCR
jgi:hypothetical protein